METGDTSHIPFREVPYLPLKVECERRADGSIILKNGHPVRPAHLHMLAPLVYWASAAPDRVWLAQRDPDQPDAEAWQTLTYGAALPKLRSLAQAMLDLGAGPDAPVMILSRNSIHNALVMYAAMWAGSPVVPVTPAYALLSEDLSRLRYIDDLVQPGILYVEDGADYQRGLDGMGVRGRAVLYSRNAPERCEAIALDALFDVTPTFHVDLAYDRLAPDMTAKYMMTSGSTGEPKAVINTHSNIATVVKMVRSVWDVERLDTLSGGPQIMCNFLPWSHTYGANAILHSLTDWGGTLYIDWGAPTPARLPEMLRNLRAISTTQHTTVPAAWAALATELERDDALAGTFFKRLLVMAYGGAAMGQDIYERIQAVAVRITGERISLSAGYGATETAPTASNVHWANDRMGLIGLPLPGCEMKLAPVGQKLECRVRGPLVTPGYYRMPEKTAAAFDDEGFYRLGDAVKLVDPDDPTKGLAFDGRIAEEFKLSNGTWVSAGTVRVQAVAACDGPLADAVVCGINKDKIALLGFLNEGWCQRHVGEALPLDRLVSHPAVIAAVRDGIDRHNRAHPNASARVARLLLQATPPRPDNGEITEKGYINQSRVQALRADDVAALFSSRPPETVLDFDRTPAQAD